MWLNEQLTSKMLEPFSISAMANLEGSHFSFLPMTKSWNYHSTINCLAEKMGTSGVIGYESDSGN